MTSCGTHDLKKASKCSYPQARLHGSHPLNVFGIWDAIPKVDHAAGACGHRLPCHGRHDQHDDMLSGQQSLPNALHGLTKSLDTGSCRPERNAPMTPFKLAYATQDVASMIHATITANLRRQ